MINSFKYIYGPVHSWRLGKSLGVDPLAEQQKVCNMDCSYCQLGKTVTLTQGRACFASTQDIVNELSSIPAHFIDYITISGRGEPTLASNLGEMIRGIKQNRREKVAVITNGILLNDVSVREELSAADYVVVKFDAANQETFENIDGVSVSFKEYIQGIAEFRKVFKGKLALQVMLVDRNFDDLDQIAVLAKTINPDEIQLNTPTRPCGEKPIERVRMNFAKRFFEDMPVTSVFDHEPQVYTPFDQKATQNRHGNYLKTRRY